jgi:hypothetical protein
MGVVVVVVVEWSEDDRNVVCDATTTKASDE